MAGRMEITMLGIIGAMDKEVAALKEQMEEVCVESKASMEFYKGRLKGKEAVVVKSGIGKVNAAVCAQVLVDEFHVDVLINTGIAGSLAAEINIGDLVVSSDAVQHDVDTTIFGDRLGQIPDMNTFSFEADKKLIELAKECCAKVNPDIQVFEGRIVSGDQFISSREKKELLSENFQGLCAEMEGAAIAHTAYLNKVPFVIVRAISDKADDSAQMDYPAFQKQAIKHSVNLMLEMAGRL